MGYVLTRINQILGGWAAYFPHAIAQHFFDALDNFTLVETDPHDARTAPLEMEGRPPPVRHARWARCYRPARKRESAGFAEGLTRPCSLV